jgi:phosphatidylserine decarboxylase
MDPFVVTSLGRKTYRTRVVRHNLNPVYDEKLVFQVQKHETNFVITFNAVDRDNFSGNDYVGKVELPLEKVISMAPEADEQTGLFPLPEWPDGMQTPIPEAKKSRFRLPLSRSSSSQSLSKLNRPTIQKENSSASLNLHPDDVPLPPAPTSAPSQSTGNGGSPPELSKITTQESQDAGLRPFVLPLDLKNKERWEAKHNPTLYIRAKYLPYLALRQQFWRAMLRQYDADESGRIDKVELTTMLDSLGSTLHESTIEGWFHQFADANPGYDHSLTFDQAVICLEDALQRTSKKTSWFTKPTLNHATSTSSFTTQDDSGSVTPSASASASVAALNINLNPQATTVPAFHQPVLGTDGEEGEALGSNDLADEGEEEHVIEIRECPICHQPRLNKRSDTDIITHIATCASQDWRQVNNIVMAGFVTASQAQRKWYSKVITKIGYGGYKLGANSANILVQDRRTGQINEERMSVYVRLGIRLLYKGLKANNMETKRSKYRHYSFCQVWSLIRYSQKTASINELQAR